MRCLFTADWQTEWSNLDLCAQAWEQVLSICANRNLEAICICGDLKRAYNPVDVRVTKWWQAAITRAVNSHFQVLVLLGNHDRISMNSDAQNWLPILEKAGARVYDSPGIYHFKDGSRIWMLPFMTLNEMVQQQAEIICRGANKKDVLAFHADLKGCKYNQYGQRSEASLNAEDLHPDSYLACIGGHIHLHQKIGNNTYYTGSPFCTDWGEANQSKGFIAVADGVEFIHSRIPGWFDESWPNFAPGDIKEGARVRIHVKCAAASNYAATLDEARCVAQNKYPGACIYTVAEFDEPVKDRATFHYSDPDKVKIAEYVRQTLPEELLSEKEKVVTYLCRRLEHASGGILRHGAKINFMSAEARNFLSFESLKVDFINQGLVVVQGRNDDRNGRSNGSGKTNFLQVVPVALFGTTFKGQKHDKWARRFSKDVASVTLTFMDSRDREVSVTRKRRPNWLSLMVGGVEQGSGMRSDAKDGTQGFIESICGFTWQTLANAVYIDSSVSRTFLSGTRKERTELLSRFQNLERFEKALQLVRHDKNVNDDWMSELSSWIDLVGSRIEDTRDFLKTLKSNRSKEYEAAAQRVDTARLEMLAEKSRFSKRSQKIKTELAGYTKEAEHLKGIIQRLDSNLQEFLLAGKETQRKISSLYSVSHKATCPTCYQPVAKLTLQKQVKEWNTQLHELTESAENIRYDMDSYRGKLSKLEQTIAACNESLESYAHDLLLKSQTHAVLEQALKKQKPAQEFDKSVERELDKLRGLKDKRAAIRKFYANIAASEAFFAYCEAAFSRNGIPAFLNAQLIPVLNKAADYYAELFADKAIQVRFGTEDGELEPQVLNAHGGETIDDQSTGEKAIAGLIASFALRELAPASNVLVLDEPGEGLDPASARQFAAALNVLKKRFSTIFLTTHNPAILSELAGEKVLTVIKQKGVSSLGG